MRPLAARTFLICLLLVLAAPRTGVAQGLLRGTVIDATTGQPIPNVAVQLVDGVRRVAETRTDSAGVFLMRTPAPGDMVLAATRIGYRTTRRGVRVSSTIRESVTIPLQPDAVKLDSIAVGAETGVLEDRLKAYLHRRQLGAGYFLNEDRLKTATGAPLSQLLRMVPGIEVTNRRTAFGPLIFTNGNQIQNQLSPFRAQGSTPNSQRQIGPCPMQLYVDGRHFSTQDMGIDIILPEDLIGVEIFRSVAELPAEFGGIHARCGVVSVWTRRVPKK
jgi:hypothetical protein